ncbi:MAG: penicillin-binding protein [Thermodesulfobacteriota bacterium]
MIRPAVKDPRRQVRLRLLTVGGVFALMGLALMGRAVDLQVFQSERLTELARREFQKKVDLVPRRGIIYDRHQQELAVSLDTDSVYARPLSVHTAAETGRRLAEALELPPAQVVERLKSEKPFVYVARRISPDKAEAVRALELKGVGLITEPRRFYPYTTLACHVLGFAGLDAQGLEGVEARYDGLLKGPPASATSLRDALGRTFQVSPAAFTSQPEGRHVILTLDMRLQYQVERILAAAVARHRAQGGQAVVMAPQTGEVLALASLPAFNPNIFGSYPKETYRNRVITDPFEPGSTFKMFVAAAALASQKVPPERRFWCEQGEWSIGGRVIHDTHPYGQLNLAEIVKVSSNIGAAKVGQAVGGAALYETFRAFGFGQETQVDLPGETGGILRPPAAWRPVDMANICFGQGVAVTGLQLTSAVAAIANRGVLMRPHLVKAVVDQSGHLVRETTPTVVRRVLGEREARQLTQMLEAVTQPGGTGTLARVEPYSVAGKTGTAQKLDPKGGYSQSDYLALFTGFLPAEDPKLAILVLIDTPRGQHYGGVVAGPAWAAIARAALASLEIAPAPPGAVMAKAKAPAAAAPAPPAPPAPQDPAPALAAGQAPDLRGHSLRQVLRLAQERRLPIKLSGWGRVARQEPAPGQPLDPAQGLSLTLTPAEGGA